MIVSHFELIYKPQSPSAPAGSAAVDNLIQGYFLEITNLFDEEIDYQLAFKAVSVSDPNRSLAGNALFILDRPDNDNAFGRLNGSINSNTFFPSTGRITLQPNETALVAVLPSAFGVIPGVDDTPLVDPSFEVRGFVEITVPADRNPGGFLLPTIPQTDVPVPTLLTPQNRTTYFKADGTISDQTQASLPLSTGMAQVNIAPNPSTSLLDDLVVVDDFDVVLERDFGRSSLTGADLIASVLATTDVTADLTALNKAMSAKGIGFAIERRKVKALEPAE